jgi:hypothetical protein
MKSQAAPITPSDQSGATDSETVVLTGEVLGDLISDGSGREWVAVGSDGGTVSVLLEEGMSDSIENLGRYQVKGSTVEVTGTYHMACEDHDGLTDVHATSIVVLDAGGSEDTAVDGGIVGSGFALVAAALLLSLLYRIIRRRSL